MIKEKRKMDKIGDLGNKNEKADIEELKAPLELGMATTLVEQKDQAQEFDALLKTFEKELSNNGNVDLEYIREMELKNDKRQKQKEISRISKDREIKPESELPRIEEEDERSRLAGSEQSIPFKSGIVDTDDNLRGTVFDRIRAKNQSEYRRH